MAYNPYGFTGAPSYIPSGSTDIQGVPVVSSVDEVRSASVLYGRQMFMDLNTDSFYIKDTMGSIKAYSFKEIPVPGQTIIDPSQYVTKEEFDELRSKYEQLIESKQPTAEPVPTQPIIDLAANATVPGDAGTSQAAILQPSTTTWNGPATGQQFIE